MKRAARIPILGGAKAFVLHRQHANLTAIMRQLSAIGLSATDCWPELPPEALGQTSSSSTWISVSTNNFPGHRARRRCRSSH